MRITHSLGITGRLLLAVFVAVLSVGAALAAQQAPGDNLARLLATKACSGCFLSGADLTGAQLEGADVSGANLFEASLYMANLKNANLAGANLQGANLKKAFLTDATLKGADLTGADLTGTIDADLSSALTTATTTCPTGAAGPCL